MNDELPASNMHLEVYDTIDNICLTSARPFHNSNLFGSLTGNNFTLGIGKYIHEIIKVLVHIIESIEHILFVWCEVNFFLDNPPPLIASIDAPHKVQLISTMSP